MTIGDLDVPAGCGACGQPANLVNNIHCSNQYHYEHHFEVYLKYLTHSYNRNNALMIEACTLLVYASTACERLDVRGVQASLRA